MERLQKIIAQSGLASRRAAESFITSGRVRVNGVVVTELGAKADPREDKIEVDGKRLVAEDPIYLVLHKPRGVVSTLSDPEGRPTVADMIKGVDARLYPVGRLDFATSGVLLMTNDGDFANGLLHPSGGVPKTYVLKVHGAMQDEHLDPWRMGIQLEDGLTQPTDVRIMRHEDDKTWLELTLREGRNQQIRRMGDATGWHVMRLARVSFAGVTSDGLRPGEWRSLTAAELLDIRKAFGVPKKVRSAAARMAASGLGGAHPHGTVRRSLRSHPGATTDASPVPVRELNGRTTSERVASTAEPRSTRSAARPQARSAPERTTARPRDGSATTNRSRPRGGAPTTDQSRRAPERAGRPEGAARATSGRRTARVDAPPVRAGRSGRSETTPRGAATRDPRARGRGGR